MPTATVIVPPELAAQFLKTPGETLSHALPSGARILGYESRPDGSIAASVEIDGLQDIAGDITIRISPYAKAGGFTRPVFGKLPPTSAVLYPRD